jgi:hypothetical protein
MGLHAGDVFRARLTARILAAVGGASVASVTSTAFGGCSSNGSSPAATTARGGGDQGGASTGSSSGAGGSSTGGAGGSGGVAGVDACFAWPLDAGACPTDPNVALAVFGCCGCPTGWLPDTVLAGPIAADAGQCCYDVTLSLCSIGTGRPYRVDGFARTSSVRADPSTSWSEAPSPGRLDPPKDGVRGASAWIRDGAAEHASVASFARLALALLRFGAPAEIVADTHRAALDEIRHARRCFAIAGAYRDERVGPGPFPLDAELAIPASIEQLAVEVLVDGCIGETVSAVAVARRADREPDPIVRDVLSAIADDEARHADLAWRSLAWAIDAGGDAARMATEKAWRGVAHAATAGSPERMPVGFVDVIAGCICAVIHGRRSLTPAT